MDQVGGRVARPKIAEALGCIAAALLFTATIAPPDVAKAAQGGAGGGGFHGGGGGFHGGGFHGGGFHGGGFHGGGFHRGFGGGRAGFAIGLGGLYPPYGWDYSYPYADTDGYPDYGYQPYAAQYWYYCSDPAGYYPYVTQCNTGWQPVPAS